MKKSDRSVTIKDIAREAGVSISTVSFAFNGTAPVAQETKERIFEVIKRLNYQPNSAARGLVTRKTNNICLFTPHPASDFFSFSGNSVFSDLLQGIGDVLDQRDYNLLIAWDNLGHKAKTPKLVKLMRERAMDGVLIALPSHDSSVIEELSEHQFPMVIVGTNDRKNQINSVDVDNYDIGYRNTKHMLGLGHSRIAFISPGPLEFLVCEDRLEGYRDALQEAGIKYREDYVFIGDEKEHSGYRAASSFLSLKETPTAVVSGRDIQAVGVLEYARENGLSVPNDLALISFENTELAQKYNITSSTTDLYEIGKEGAKLLHKVLTRKKDRSAQNVVIASELIIRSSCGAKPKS
ncbi:LacI family DNA-binding transcriptional regulator [Paenibacillus sacheonensis]|uniref:Substrate-binding domain-containing protein n=1 Tax=Paenibacillus sacheonensis TaxID=742054 RepID=A0A7X5C248_9BACL|nr:LacI family DNA-binding transcriptional regulator [Paenibacillus sacheonensis]MBM7567170.1 DNA-binding LacI/PurR family transcriptional regulator [Paenibacillus sacheonensis]NBC70905.1 substrate-binding domain-containing protein [Paenibacillus sacheonensis]